MASIQKDATQSRDAKRKMQYDPLPSLDQLHLKSQPLALAYPQAEGAKEFDQRYREIVSSVREMLPP
jgi:hypothetical protein